MAGAAVSPNPIPPTPSFLPSTKPRVIILGGTGRVGASTAAALSRFCPSVRLVVAGRNREKGAALVSKLGKNTEFVHVNIDDIYSIQVALEGMDLVVHSAGPFQQEQKCNVLEAAISSKTAYLDVCDDTNYAWRAKSFHEKAVSAGVTALTTCGIYPGPSLQFARKLPPEQQFLSIAATQDLNNSSSFVVPVAVSSSQTQLAILDSASSDQPPHSWPPLSPLDENRKFIINSSWSNRDDCYRSNCDLDHGKSSSQLYAVGQKEMNPSQ